MKRPGFFRGVVVAAVLALVGAIAYSGLATLIGAGFALKLITVALGGAYVLYLLSGTEDRTGRIAVFVGWLTVTGVVGFLTAGLTMTLITQVLLISTIRALYHHGSVLAALLDLGLSAFALSALVWASAESGSLFLSVWTFFLVQALFVAIPSDFKTQKAGAQKPEADQFDRAFRTAESAIRRIATERS